MTGKAVERSYSLTHVQQALGLSRHVVKGLIDAGFVTPLPPGEADAAPREQREPHEPHEPHEPRHRRGRRRPRYSFQDLMLLRTAYALQQAQVPPRKILDALHKLRSRLPAELPLTGLRIAAVGSEIVVREREGPWSVDSGQWLIDFEVEPDRGSVVFMSPQRDGDSSAMQDAAAWFARAEVLETSDRRAAGAAYERVLQIDPTHLHATLNLGALWCEDSRCDDAAVLYDAALARGVASPLLHFNHAIALEDQQRLPQALASYERALALDPTLEDAHYNAGRLHEAAGNAQRALRHFSAYRRLKRTGGR